MSARKKECTPQILETIQRMHDGCSLATISEELGVSCRVLKRWMRENGIESRTHLEAGMVRAKKMVPQIRSRPPIYTHTDRVRSQVFALRGQLSASQIAAHLGLKSRNVVVGIWNRRP